jgi:signal transduction histidine kinase
MSLTVQPDIAKEPPAAEAEGAAAVRGPGTTFRSRLFTKYVALFVAVVAVALLSNGIFEVFFYYREHKAALIRIQHEQAEAAAAKISQFVKEIESQVGWTTQLPWSAGSIEQRRFDAVRLLRQVPAVTELAQVDSTGKERLRFSRLAMDVVESGLDLSNDPKFTEAVAKKVYYGPVYFRRESEPYMTLALAGTRKDVGVSIVEVNLKLIWDVVSQIKVGERGHAYVVGPQGRLIAHPDISLVLRNTDMSNLVQVQSAQGRVASESSDALQGALNIQGQEVLTASAPIAALGWTVFVELPVEEAYASLYQALQRLAVLLLAASVFAVLAGIFLARRMVGPIQALRAGAERIGGGDFTKRISIKTGDELEGLANQFNDMGVALQESYTDLENKVDQRTAELSESLQFQTATSEVLKVISRSTTNVQPVFEAIATSAARLFKPCETTITTLQDGYLHWRATASLGGPVEAMERAKSIFPIPFDPEHSPSAQAMLERRIIEIADAMNPDTPETTRRAQSASQFCSITFVPLLRDGVGVGTIILTHPDAGFKLSAKQLALVQTFADQAVIAIENARLFEEVQERTRELSEALVYQTGSGNILRVIASSPTNVKPVLKAIVDSACDLCEAVDAVVLLKDGGDLHFSEHHGSIPIGIDKWPINRNWTAGRAFLDQRPVHVHDLRSAEGDDFPDGRELSQLMGHRTILSVPLLSENESVGAIVLRRTEVQPFSEKQITLLQTFADQAVIAISNVRLFEEVQQRTRELSLSLDELRTAQDRLVQTEKLASLGHLTAGIAHEIKNPLNFVNNFSALSAELIDELNDVLKPAALDGKMREEIDELTQMLKGNLEKVIQHGKRADSIVKNMLLHSREGAGEHRPADINAIVEESLNLAYHGARAEQSNFNITLHRNFDPEAGLVDLFPQEITRVFLNLVSNGFYAATKRKEAGDEAFEPSLTASTKTLGNRVEIRIRDNGTGIPDHVKEKIFNPFFTTKPAGEGTGLGLSMSHDIIVKQHGGTIDVDTAPGQFTEFIITLPRTAAAQSISGGTN